MISSTSSFNRNFTPLRFAKATSELVILDIPPKEAARTNANRQTRYLSMSVNPIAADEPAYPRAFENTLVVALIFAGLYLMLSMTAAILKEQITA